MNYRSKLAGLLSSRHVFRPARIIETAQAFLSVEASSGIILLAAALGGLIWVNSPWSDSYASFWHTRVLLDARIFVIDEDLRGWVDDGLMTLFFFLVGLEIKRELVHGEMSDPRRAMLPAVAALGGMLAPALIYTAFNSGGPGRDGWAVPMATDIAFSVGVLSLLGGRVPFSIKVFLLALAIADDIGAVVVIAVFYSSGIDFGALAIAAGLLAVAVALNRAGVREVGIYVVLGLALWLATHESGVHATLAGVALGLLTPARSFYAAADYPRTAAGLLGDFQQALMFGDDGAQQGILAQTEDLSRGTEAPLDRLERALHPWVSYAVVPAFALASTGVDLRGGVLGDAVSSGVTQGVVLGLVLGKPAGIFLLTWLAVRLGLSELPAGVAWRHLLGIGLLGGIGFTVSLLITGLAFDEALLVDDAKIGVLAGSVVAGLLGFAFLWLSGKGNRTQDVES